MPNPVSSGPNQSLLSPDEASNSLECAYPATTAPSGPALSAPPDPGSASSQLNGSQSSPKSTVDDLVAQYSKPATTGAAAERSLYQVQEYAPDGEFERGSMGVYNRRNADGSSVTLLDFSLQKGQDKNVQLTAESSNFSLEHSGYGWSLTGDVGVFRANHGVLNDDGSVGHHIGLSAEAAGLEATITTPVASITLGASISEGLAASSGVRDADHDGKPEYCAKVSIPAFTLGYCLERFW